MPGPLFRAQVDRLERNENQSVVRRTAPAQTESHNRKGPKDVIVLTDDLPRFVRYIGSVGKRRTGRRLHNADQIILIFRWKKSARCVLVKINRSCQAGDKEQQ